MIICISRNREIKYITKDDSNKNNYYILQYILKHIEFYKILMYNIFTF